MYKIIFAGKTLLLLLCLHTASAQTIPQFTQYVFNNFYNNPGNTGLSNRSQIQANFRSQYTGYVSDVYAGGNNNNAVFAIDVPMAKLKGGIGLYASSNSFSKIQNKQELFLSYSYHKRFNSTLMGVGISAGLNSLGLSYDNYVPRDKEDPLIGSQNQTFISPSLHTGVFIQNPVYQVGLSVKNILNTKYNIGTADASIKEKRTFYLNGKYDYGLTYNLDISPIMLIKTDLNQISTELGLIGTYKQKLWAGLNYRWQDAVGIMVGTNALNNNIKFGYAFDYIVTGLNAKSTTSHEIMVRYSLSPIKIGKKAIIRTPRYNF
jgi:type IX secretion system PorP/SprF family membrane protein